MTALRIHLGGHQAKEGWTLLNAQAGPGVDVVGNCTDLSMFKDGSATEIYASHIYEHLGYQQELLQALKEANRVLVRGGVLRIAVLDLEVLCQLLLDKRLPLQARWEVQRMIYGGQIDQWDFHKCGFSFDLLVGALEPCGFREIRRVSSFGIFQDTSDLRFLGTPISLNVQCNKA